MEMLDYICTRGIDNPKLKTSWKIKKLCLEMFTDATVVIYSDDNIYPCQLERWWPVAAPARRRCSTSSVRSMRWTILWRNFATVVLIGATVHHI